MHKWHPNPGLFYCSTGQPGFPRGISNWKYFFKKWTHSLHSPPLPSHPWKKKKNVNKFFRSLWHVSWGVLSIIYLPSCVSQCSPFQRPLRFPRTFQLHIRETKFSSYPSIETTYSNRLNGELDMRIQTLKRLDLQKCKTMPLFPQFFFDLEK